MTENPDLYPLYLASAENLPSVSLVGKSVPRVNVHIHTPHSFSAFTSMEQPFTMARQEEVAVLGINDFYTTGGYPEFAALALDHHVFPLFNIEFMALQPEEQRRGIRVNDPVNPGRTYLSGKGVSFPVSMSEKNRKKLETLQVESNRQTYSMVEKLNEFLAQIHSDIRFDATAMQHQLARNLLRERHIAMAVRIAIAEKYHTEEERRDCLKKIFNGKEPKSSFNQIAALENEIRNNLLKSGGPAYVPEDEKAFLTLAEVNSLIRDAGGIPCYPVLLDDAKGNFTDFEEDWEKMADRLAELGIYMIELIPGRNDFGIVKDFVGYFHSRGFVVSFGTEHNTPQLDQLTVTCRGGIALDEELMQINFRGAAIIAAHQYQIANGRPGFPGDHFPCTGELDILEQLGTKLICAFTQP